MSSFPDTACSIVRWCNGLRSAVLVLSYGLACCFALCAEVSAHDIPSDVKLQVFVKPRAQQLTLLVRVPMAALREVDIPLRPGGYIDLGRAEPALREAAAVWLLDNLALFEEGQPLPRPAIVQTRISLASDRSFTDYDRALGHLAGPRIAETEQLYWNQQLLDVQLQVPIASARSHFSVEPRFARLGLRVALALRFLPETGEERAYELHGDPGVVHLDPRWHQAAWRFVQAGVWHILEGPDHLLFLACLVIPVRRLRTLVLMATAFTVAHSITLLATAFGLGPQGLWFPPLVETLIAASILWMALANIFGASAHRRWMTAFVFGLVHGFGFAFALRESLQFAGSHVVSALLAFNVGIELGQVAALVIMLPLVALLLRVVPERAGVIVLSALAAHTAWHWMLERGEVWWRYPLPRPDAADWGQLLGWAIAAVAIGVVLIALRDRAVRLLSERARRVQ
jgi:HupE / UreJ protein